MYQVNINYLLIFCVLCQSQKTTEINFYNLRMLPLSLRDIPLAPQIYSKEVGGQNASLFEGGGSKSRREHTQMMKIDFRGKNGARLTFCDSFYIML